MFSRKKRLKCASAHYAAAYGLAQSARFGSNDGQSQKVVESAHLRGTRRGIDCQNRYMNEEFRTVAQVAEMLGVSGDTVRRLFSNEPGVIDLGQRETNRGKRRYRVLRIPSAVVARFLERRSVK